MRLLRIIIKRIRNSKGNCNRSVVLHSYLHRHRIIRCQITERRNTSTDTELEQPKFAKNVLLKVICIK